MSATTPCAHCGEPAIGPANEEGQAFCCAGCEAVYSAIHDEGFAAFYALRDATGTASPATEGPQDNAARFDSPDFLDAHSEVCEDGTHQIDLYLDGVHCAGCVWIVERLPHSMEGVREARLDLSRARLRLRWDPAHRPLSEVVGWLRRFGYSAHAIRAEGLRGRTDAERRLLIKVGICWALAGNVMLLAAALYAGLTPEQDAVMSAAVRWLSLGLSAASVWIGGRVFLARAWVSASALWTAPGRAWRSMSMDVPISLGILVGWGHSAWSTVSGTGEVWFDSVSVLIAALLTARWLQLRGRRMATDAADRLLSLIPATARRVLGDAVEEVPAATLQAGDLVEVRAGEAFPADGEVIVGASLVHRGVLTGESVPEPVGLGERVHAGATNLGSVLRVRVEASGEHSRVGRLLRWIEAQAETRAPVVQTADRWSGIFVAAVVVSAALTALCWTFIDPTRAAAHTVALLVISCPCALGMATPLALSVAVGHAARRGIFIKHDDVIEELADTTHVVLDKTGTLTQGRMSLLELRGDDRSVELAARLESGSNHPVAHALLRWGGQEVAALGEPEALREHQGCGMSGVVEGQQVLIGRPDWVFEQAETTPEHVEDVEAITARGRTPVAVAVAGRVEALVGLGDPVRAEARALISALKARSIQPVILSGDHPRVVASTALQIGVEDAFAHGGASPEDKRDHVARLASTPGCVVVMVGDGVNDAAALQAAHVGISVHGGTEASLVASDIFITRPGLAPVLALFESADEAMATIRRNLFASLLYNAAGITLAALGFVGPLLAAVAMPLSSLGVVASSLSQRPAHRTAPPKTARLRSPAQILRKNSG